MLFCHFPQRSFNISALARTSVRKLGIGEVISTNRCHENLRAKLPLTDVMKTNKNGMKFEFLIMEYSLYACDWIYLSIQLEL